MTANCKKAFQVFLSLAVLFAVSFFFYREFQKNWGVIQSYDLKTNALFIGLSFFAIACTYLLTTYGWFFTLNFLSDNKITFPESVALVNTSNLTKYIPGKVWSYALQMYWLAKLGFSKSRVLYVNLINLYVSLVAALILGIAYLAFSPGIVPHAAILALLCVLAAFEAAFIAFNAPLMRRVVAVLNAVLKRDIEVGSPATSPRLLAYLHLVYGIAAFCFGAGASVLCFGIGFEIAADRVLPVMAAFLISEVVGFIAVVTPGGLGVREAVMYLLLRDVSPGAFALILPLATRLVSMAADVLFGSAALLLFRNYRKTLIPENRKAEAE